jgi:primary-amine oxidase
MQLRCACACGILAITSFLLVSCTSFIRFPSGVAYPLDPLNASEIRQTVQILKESGRFTSDLRFASLALNEPPKEEVQKFQPGKAFRREAFAILYDRKLNQTFEAVVDLNGRSVQSWKQIPGVQPAMIAEDFTMAERAVRADTRWQAAMKKRGISDFKKVVLVFWPPGYYGESGEPSFRWCRVLSYDLGDSYNPWARPIDGVIADVNLNSGEVFRFKDIGLVSLPRNGGEYASSGDSYAPFFSRVRARIPYGMPFQVNGNEVRWRNWRFRFAMHPREGLVLYTVAYQDQGQFRSILYRASLSEVLTTYGDSSPGWYFRNIFDEGETGLGSRAGPLVPGVDLPANARFFTAVLADSLGSPVERGRAVAIFERDREMLWRHSYAARSAPELVLFYTVTVGNYDYGFSWIFHDDGELEVQVLLTGITLVHSRDGGGNADNAQPVGENVAAVNHQHFFNFRLDMDVDGVQNTVVEQSAEPASNDGSGYGNSFRSKETMLQTEKQARRIVDSSAGRIWRVINRASFNALGKPVGYALVPEENALPLSGMNSWVRKRAGFVNAHLWVTPFDPHEYYAAGAYPYQSHGDDGLATWTEADRTVEDRDIVLWYTLGITHIPRPEEWPIMPVHRAGFRLVPDGFFSSNPTSHTR